MKQALSGRALSGLVLSGLVLTATFLSGPALAEPVTLPGPGGLTLQAELVRPTGPVRAPAIVALHGCGGPYPRRDLDWANRLAALGHIVLLPDSFGSRHAGSQCRTRSAERVATAAGARRLDAIAAARWLATQPGTPPGGVALLGWSDGGWTTVMAAARAPDVPAGLFVRFVAFYPVCRQAIDNPDYVPVAPMLILHGELDDWDPIGPCRALAERFPKLVTLVAYPDTWHDFDVPNGPDRLITGVARNGVARVAPNPAARADALARVPAFLEAR